ncbi:MAG: hypothetical protein ACM3X1_10065, partial [Ignavibacteriales bacterium]
KAYLQVKDILWSFISLVHLFQKSRIGEGEVVELLKIANGYLPRIRLEYDRLKEEKKSLEVELSPKKAELNNTARTYQQFVDRNIELNKREDELQLSINGLEAKEDELQRIICGLKQQLSELREFNLDNNTLDPEINQEKVIFTNDENEIPYYYSQVEPSSRTLVFDTKNLFSTKAQT